MATATLTKVGNSMAVLLPKALREEAGFSGESLLNLNSPRKGVVVITSLLDDGEDRLEKLKAVEERITNRTKSNPWPIGLTADDLIKSGKDTRANGIDTL